MNQFQEKATTLLKLCVLCAFCFFAKMGFSDDWKPKVHKSDPEIIAAVKTKDLGYLKLLIKKTKDLEKKDEMGFTAIHWSILVESVEMTKLLISNGANVNSKGGGWEISPLMEAVSRNNIELVKILLDSGADPNYKDLKGRYAITLTTDKNIKDVLRKEMKENPLNEPRWKKILKHIQEWMK